ncbi:hypothetical protein [Sporosarcina sp. 6E9]|nr:hypothetical protein [Sporosarcina sp. 6E9]
MTERVIQMENYFMSAMNVMPCMEMKQIIVKLAVVKAFEPYGKWSC